MAKDLNFQPFTCCSNHTPAAQFIQAAWIRTNLYSHHPKGYSSFLVYFPLWNFHVTYVLKSVVFLMTYLPPVSLREIFLL
jgi:hypothetical protein